jgi:hypothetical protein
LLGWIFVSVSQRAAKSQLHDPAAACLQAPGWQLCVKSADLTGRSAAGVVDARSAAVCRALLARAMKVGDADAVTAEARVDDVYNELRKWVDVKDKEYVGIYAGREERRGRPAAAIKVRTRWHSFCPVSFFA